MILMSVAGPVSADEPPTRDTWLQSMRDALPKRSCRDGGAGRNCYRASQAACVAVETELARECLDGIRDRIPARVAASDGASLGGAAGLCTADRYELVFGDVRDLQQCPLDETTATTAMKKADWVAALEAGLPARLCAEADGDDAACREAQRASVAKCLSTVAAKAPAKLLGCQRADWLKRVVGCASDHKR
jgi:hypothetical protein